MLANYKHKLGIGCALCKHVWFILTNDDDIPNDIQVKWVKDLLMEHYNVHRKIDNENSQ